MALQDDRTPGSLWDAGDAEAVVRRIWYVLPVVSVVLFVVAMIFATREDAAGILVGVGLAAVNFRLLENSLRSLLGAGHEKPPQGTTLMFVIRWAIVAMLGYAFHRSGLASGGGILVGLFSPAIAITLEAVYQLVAVLRGRQSE